MNRTLFPVAAVAQAIVWGLTSPAICVVVAQGGELPLHGVEGLCLQRPPSTSPATRVESWAAWGQLLRLSDTRWLALVSETKARLDRWADPKRIQEEARATGVSSAKFEFVENQWVLAVVDRGGKIRQRSPALEEGSFGSNFAQPGGGESR